MRDIRASTTSSQPFYTTLSGSGIGYYFPKASKPDGYPKYGSWADVETFCQQLGGHIPSIHSDGQVNHISGVFQAMIPWYFANVEPRIAVGLPLSTSAVKTAWVDGTALDWGGATVTAAGKFPHLNLITGQLGQHENFANWYGILNGTILPFVCAGEVLLVISCLGSFWLAVCFASSTLA